MNLEIHFQNAHADGRVFLTWRPVKCAVSIRQPTLGAVNPAGFVTVRMMSATMGDGGKIAFYTDPLRDGAATLDLALPADGTPVDLWVGGEFGAPSAKFGDVSVRAHALDPADGQPLAAVLLDFPVMVRVRKNANFLSAAERDRFLSALATLNGQGAGIFKQFRDTHVAGMADRQAHNGPGFLPWHRAFLLDLEREMQNLDPEVTLPYWRFDQSAPKVVNRAFMGVPDANGTVEFNSGHPLLSWSTDGQVGVLRGRGVTATNIPQPQNSAFRVLTEAQTMQLSDGPNANFANFANMEGTPHGAAHMANWSGPITVISTAARDPLFFLLHCNIDRLWAKWQWLNRLHDPATPASFSTTGRLKGHRLNDTLWPWDNDTAPPRPNFALRTPLPGSLMTAAPGPNPRVSDMIDYLAMSVGGDLAFAYDDVPFEP